MGDDRLAALLADELEVRHGTVQRWGAHIAAAIRAALVSGDLTPTDLGMEQGPSVFFEDWREPIRRAEVRQWFFASEKPPPDPRCARGVGSRPDWMSRDQYDPCRCRLLAGHDGHHWCEHLDTEPPSAVYRVPPSGGES